MRVNKNNAEMPTTWTYGIIWSVIMAIAAVALRYVLWYNMVWMGDVDVFSDKFCSNSIILLCVSVLIGLIMYLVSYNGYRKLAATNITDLHGVCHDHYGKPWIITLILTLLLELLWTAICVVILVIVCELNVFLSADDMTVVLTFAAINGIGLVVDVVLFLVGNFFFKPKEVMEKK